jgi:hypothetical protein
MWPIGCSLFAQNITARLRGDNVLLWKDSTPTPTNNPTPFIRSHAPNDPLEIAWVRLMFLSSVEDPGYYWETTHRFLPLNLLLLSGLNSTDNSLALLGERLTNMTSLSYALLVHDWRTSPPDGGWNPVFAIASGSRSFVMAGLVVQILPLAIGAVTCSIIIIVFVAVSRRSQLSDDIIRDGRVLNVISLLHNSSLPAIITDSDENIRDLPRDRAVRTYAL